jgi:putative ABC transport system permease protein
MLLYQLRMGLKSLRRNPVLSLLIICGIGLGIGVSTTFTTVHYILSLDPIPEKSHVLYYVEIDNWDPNRGWRDDDPQATPNQITYRDMVGLMQSDIPTYQGGSFKASLYLHPDPKVGRPFKVLSRMCFAGFFELFQVPFAYGSSWDSQADKGPDPVVVLSHDTNQKLFGGENSVGRLVRLEDREYRVVGVLKPWRPLPKFYDTHNGAFEKPEEVFLPFDHFRPLELRSAGNTSNWDSFDWNDYEAYLASETIWIQFWVQLDTAAQREAYVDFLRSYVEEQKKLGRMQRAMNNKLFNVTEWLEEAEAVPEEATTLMAVSLLFLAVCALNLIGILLGKFLARSPEISVRRALGASRRAVFLQQLVECELVGLLGGVLGVLLAMLGLAGVNGLFRADFSFGLNIEMLVVAVLLALLAGLVAGVYPAWRVCSIPPAVHLREG